MSDKGNCYHDQLARMKMLDTSKKMKESAQKDDAVTGEDHEAMRLSLDASDVVFSSYPERITLETQDCLQTLIGKVVRWHYDRNLIDGSTDKDQTLKLMQELGELSDSVCKGKDIKDDIGDMLVVMLNITERNGVSLAECLERAWDEIKDRKGRMVDGVFVKEGDL